jgi:uncharacterized protein YndB with AHSA1/START domain
MHLTRVPAVKVGLLMRKPPANTFAAIADPAITTRFWYTKSTGPMTEGAELTWEWEMYGASSRIRVQEVEQDRRIRFSWSGYDPEHPTTVEFRFIPWQDDTTYVLVTETGISGDGDTMAERLADSTAGFTFLLVSLKAFLEYGIELGVVMDAHPVGLEV